MAEIKLDNFTRKKYYMLKVTACGKKSLHIHEIPDTGNGHVELLALKMS